jgi:hypothetical protein
MHPSGPDELASVGPGRARSGRARTVQLRSQKIPDSHLKHSGLRHKTSDSGTCKSLDVSWSVVFSFKWGGGDGGYMTGLGMRP